MKNWTKVPHKYAHALGSRYDGMIARCYKPWHKSWRHYGGRGIKVCEEWRNDRRAFYKWCAENGHSPKLQLDRKDNNGDYSPSNCQFVDRIAQANNKRGNRILHWGGESKTVAEWARYFGIKHGEIHHRLCYGWTASRIFALFQQPKQ